MKRISLFLISLFGVVGFGSHIIQLFSEVSKFYSEFGSIPLTLAIQIKGAMLIFGTMLTVMLFLLSAYIFYLTIKNEI